MGDNLKNFYLNTPMEHYEYPRLQANFIPQELMDEYNLQAIIKADGYIYLEIFKMYDLPQARCIANDFLKNHLKPFRYY